MVGPHTDGFLGILLGLWYVSIPVVEPAVVMGFSGFPMDFPPHPPCLSNLGFSLERCNLVILDGGVLHKGMVGFG